MNEKNCSNSLSLKNKSFNLYIDSTCSYENSANLTHSFNLNRSIGNNYQNSSYDLLYNSKNINNSFDQTGSNIKKSSNSVKGCLAFPLYQKFRKIEILGSLKLGNLFFNKIKSSKSEIYFFYFKLNLSKIVKTYFIIK